MLGIVFSLAAAGVASSAVCPCPSVQLSTKERLQHAAWVFVGKVTDKVEAKDTAMHPSGSAWGWAYPVDVSRVWKDSRIASDGAPPHAITVWDDCPVQVDVGKEYVFFADATGTVSRCDAPVARPSGAHLEADLDHLVAHPPGRK